MIHIDRVYITWECDECGCISEQSYVDIDREATVLPPDGWSTRFNYTLLDLVERWVASCPECPDCKYISERERHLGG